MNEESTATESTSDKPAVVRQTFRLAWRALMLDPSAYRPLLTVEKPFKRGMAIVAVFLLPVALATSLGLVLDYLTLPKLNNIQETIFSLVSNSRFFQDLFAEPPYLALLSTWLYNLVWFLIRSAGNYPSQLHAVGGLISIPLFGIFDFITYSFIAQVVAVRLGATGDRKRFYAPMALAYAPRLLLIANIIPGLVVPASLIRVWIYATSYQAIRATFDLSWKRSIVVVILPYLITTLLLIISLLGGVALGVAVSQLIS